MLHSHIPYVLAHGRSPHGTDWLSEAAAETYLPLLHVCHRLIAEGLSPKITLGLTPVLVEQLRDPSFQDELSDYLRGRRDAAQRSNQEQFRREGNYHMAYLARFWEDWYGTNLSDFEDPVRARHRRRVRKALQDAGHIEVITSSATHGYSALLSQDTSIQAQVKQGVLAYKRHFGRAPRGYWLPECSYRPRYHWAPPLAVPDVPKIPWLHKGTDEFLAENGIEYFFVEGSLLHGGETLGVYADKFGPLKELYKQFQAETVKTQYRPYTPYKPYVIHSSPDPALPGVAVLGRDSATGKQVWSGEHGYPGDEWYLEFHKKFVERRRSRWACATGASRRTRRTSAPRTCTSRTRPRRDHARPRRSTSSRLVKDVLRRSRTRRSILCAVYDTELYGHWWFEGPQWLYHVIKQLAQDPEMTLATVSEYLAAHPATLPVDAAGRLVGRGRLPLHLAQRGDGLVVEVGV